MAGRRADSECPQPAINYQTLHYPTASSSLSMFVSSASCDSQVYRTPDSCFGGTFDLHFPVKLRVIITTSTFDSWRWFGVIEFYRQASSDCSESPS